MRAPCGCHARVVRATRAHGTVGRVRVLAVALTFWMHAGYHPKACVRVDVVPLPRGVLGRTYYGGCVVEVAARLLPARTRADVVRLCTTVTHEVGHTLGLHHARRGIMAPSYERARVPPGCWRVRAPVVRREFSTRPGTGTWSTSGRPP